MVILCFISPPLCSCLHIQIIWHYHWQRPDRWTLYDAELQLTVPLCNIRMSQFSTISQPVFVTSESPRTSFTGQCAPRIYRLSSPCCLCTARPGSVLILLQIHLETDGLIFTPSVWYASSLFIQLLSAWLRNWTFVHHRTFLLVDFPSFLFVYFCPLSLCLPSTSLYFSKLSLSP